VTVLKPPRKHISEVQVRIVAFVGSEIGPIPRSVRFFLDYFSPNPRMESEMVWDTFPRDYGSRGVPVRYYTGTE